MPTTAISPAAAMSPKISREMFEMTKALSESITRHALDPGHSAQQDPMQPLLALAMPPIAVSGITSRYLARSIVPTV
jgi:hypothetical protein